MEPETIILGDWEYSVLSGTPIESLRHAQEFADRPGGQVYTAPGLARARIALPKLRNPDKKGREHDLFKDDYITRSEEICAIDKEGRYVPHGERVVIHLHNGGFLGGGFFGTPERIEEAFARGLIQTVETEEREGIIPVAEHTARVDEREVYNLIYNNKVPGTDREVPVFTYEELLHKPMAGMHVQFASVTPVSILKGAKHDNIESAEEARDHPVMVSRLGGKDLSKAFYESCFPKSYWDRKVMSLFPYGNEIITDEAFGSLVRVCEQGSVLATPFGRHVPDKFWGGKFLARRALTSKELRG